MCGGAHYGEVEGLISVERWSCSRGASCVAEVATYFIRLPLPDVEGGCLEVLNGLLREDVLGVRRRLVLLAFADGITDPPLAVDSINLKPGNGLRGHSSEHTHTACGHNWQ